MIENNDHAPVAFDAIGFDADDTLWHDIPMYASIRQRFDELLAPHHGPEWIEQKLYETERRNLAHFGYGVKGFALSLVETAIELTDGAISGREIQRILDACKAMSSAPLALLDHAEEAVAALAARYPLILLTKGDLLDQETKLARSGLGRHFAHVEVVSEKTPATYARVLQKHRIAPARFLMVGNSLRSDVLPPLAIGARAVHVPYPTTWVHEHVPATERDAHAFHAIEHLGELPALVADLAAGRAPRAAAPARATQVWGGAKANDAGGER